MGQRFASQYGPPPFDPVSLGLAWLLAWWRGWSWPQLVTELHSGERGQGYARRLGFRSDDLPSAATFRMALNVTAPAWVVQCADSWALSLLAYGLIPSHATFPHDPPERGDQYRPRQPTRRRPLAHALSAHERGLFPATRPRADCAAQADGQEGCACDTPACQDHCRLATPRDPEAAYVYYKGSNQTPGAPPPATGAAADTPATVPTGRGKHHFGYKSKAFNVLDDRLFTYWPLAGPYAAADRNDHLQTIPGFAGSAPPLPHPRPSAKSPPTPAKATTTILTYVHDDLRACA